MNIYYCKICSLDSLLWIVLVCSIKWKHYHNLSWYTLVYHGKSWYFPYRMGSYYSCCTYVSSWLHVWSWWIIRRRVHKWWTIAHTLYVRWHLRHAWSCYTFMQREKDKAEKEGEEDRKSFIIMKTLLSRDEMRFLKINNIIQIWDKAIDIRRKKRRAFERKKRMLYCWCWRCCFIPDESKTKWKKKHKTQ